MFPGRFRKGKEQSVEKGFPTLLRAMAEAQVNTPARVAAFLTTVVFESFCEYDIHQFNDTRLYAGRGYIQLTGLGNYTAAGQYFGIDLVNNPDLALSLEWSAPIARWYWTINRHINPLADALQMGKVNRAIGYPLGDGKADQARCAAFASALNYLTGSVPTGITCTR